MAGAKNGRRSAGSTGSQSTPCIDGGSKYGGMQVSEARKLKQLLADAHLDNAALKELLSKNW